jgi:signal transduction histidine kinase
MKPDANQTSHPTPIPARQFQRFMLVWHVFYFGFFLYLIYGYFSHSQPVFTGKSGLVALLCAVQMGMYLKYLVFSKLDQSLQQWLVYFLVNIPCWYVLWKLDPRFLGVAFIYMGHMYGVLPPLYSLPISLALMLVAGLPMISWESFKTMRTLDAIVIGGILVSWIAVALFMRQLAVTSSDRARLITRLEEAQRELELAQKRESELAVLRERERLAREMHDSLGHSLVTLTVQLEAIQRLYPRDPARAVSLLEESKKITRLSMEALRRALNNLRMPGLGERTLSEAMKERCQELQEHSGIQMAMDIVEPSPCQPAVAETLWLVFHEAITNMERHSKAQKATLQLHQIPGEVQLLIADNGVGIPDNAESMAGHYGLRGMRERVEGVGGSLCIERIPNPGDTGRMGATDSNKDSEFKQGTRLSARIPI